MTELKSCPFCGSKAIVHTWFAVDKKLMYLVRCENDECRIQPTTDYHVSEEVVVREWNRREKSDENA